MFLVVAKKSRTSSSLPCSVNEQGCRSWEWARPDSWPKLAHGNIPQHRRHAQVMNRGWLEGRNLFFSFSFPVSMNPLLSSSLTFSESSVFFKSFAKFMKSASSRFYSCCSSGTGCESVIGWWEDCIVYSLFCIFIVISSRISFVALLNCLYLNPWVFPFVHFSCPSHWGEGEGWASGCLVLSCWLLG